MSRPNPLLDDLKSTIDEARSAMADLHQLDERLAGMLESVADLPKLDNQVFSAINRVQKAMETLEGALTLSQVNYESDVAMLQARIAELTRYNARLKQANAGLARWRHEAVIFAKKVAELYNEQQNVATLTPTNPQSGHLGETDPRHGLDANH